MGIFTDLKRYLPFGQKAQLTIFDNPSWQRIELSRRSNRIYYNSDAAFAAYRAHELVYACINKIADVMNDVEIIVEKQNSKKEWDKVDGHALPGLFKKPNALQTGRDFRRLLVQSEQGVGMFYIAINRSAAGVPAELLILNPNRVVARTLRDQLKISHYEYTRADGQLVKIKPEDLLIRRRPDLLDQYFGFAPLAAALKSINSDLGLTDYVDAFFESDGTPSGILKIKNASINDTKKEALQAQWRAKYSRGGSNQKGLAVLDQEAEYQPIGSKLDELASEELSGRFESRICAVFGVPPNLVGAQVGLVHVTANATAKSELRNFWDNKISPELAALREWLTWFVLPEFEDIESIRAEKIRVGFDLSQCAFLQEDVDQIHKRARENFRAGGWTLNEFREATGMPPDAEAGDDYYIQQNTVFAISPAMRALEAEKEPGAANEPDPSETDSTQEPDPASEDDSGKLAIPVTHQKKTFDLDGLTLGREPQGVELIIDLKKIASDLETEKQKLAKILKRFKNDLIDQAVAKLDKMAPEEAHTLVLVPDPEIQKAIAKQVRNAYRTGQQQIIDELHRQNDAKSGGARFELKDEPLDEDELTDLTISRIINEIQKRAVDWYTMLRLLLDYTADKLKEKLFGESEKWIEQLAGNTANISIQYGRDAEIENNLDQIAHCEYSAVMDANTCGPCEAADGETGATPDDLPDAPNPDCEGGANCRCFIIGVIV
jgi:HK97 family phage portal protein